ncbi:MAG TPA: Flp family type IVb pilin [Mycobacteriales bacterium]|jgi:pilus assembly protein Flp/PilA|nr:Flp family type IVb pilin [Mycobacteriales bacterium]
MLGYLRDVVAAKKDEGASAVEYGLLVAAIAALIVIIVFALGNIVKDVFGNTCDNIRSNTSGTTVACNR